MDTAPTPTPKPDELTAEDAQRVAQRIDQLKAQSWPVIAEAATKVGIAKTQDQTWRDMADEIALAELKKGILASIDPVPAPFDKGVVVAPIYYARTGGVATTCPTCNEKLRSANGQPICPIRKAGCSRNQVSQG